MYPRTIHLIQDFEAGCVGSNLDRSARSWARRRPGYNREHHLIKAGLNEGRGCVGAMGMVMAVCWAIVAAHRLSSGCRTFPGWTPSGQSVPVYRQDSDFIGLLSRLREAIGVARRMTPACAAILKADGSMAGNGTDVMACHSG